MSLSRTPEPPYYAAIFTSLREEDARGYAEMAEQMLTLASEQPGFLGVDSVRDADGLGITVSYWKDEASIAAWREHGEHQLARKMGREQWYRDWTLRVAKVERTSEAGQ